MIESIGLIENISIGPSMTPMQRLVNGATIDGYKVDVTFDDDPRFLLLKMTDGKRHFVQLINLHNVLNIVVTPDGRRFKTKTQADAGPANPK